MTVNRTRCLILLLEIFILVIMYIIMIVLRLQLPTFKRGFFCDDESLMHPYKGSTVPYWSVLVVGFIVNFLIIFILVPILLHRDGGVTFTTRNIGYIFSVMWPNVLMLMYGFCITYAFTEIVKNMIGRFRPHFIPLCEPSYSGNCTATRGYIENFRCTSKTATVDELAEVRKSFPSGHTSSAFYFATAFAILLQKWMQYRSLVVFKAFLQACMFAVALYVGVSRISDYKHHWSDVLAGGFLGISVAACSFAIFNRFIGRSDDELNDGVNLQTRNVNKEAVPLPS